MLIVQKRNDVFSFVAVKFQIYPSYNRKQVNQLCTSFADVAQIREVKRSLVFRSILPIIEVYLDIGRDFFTSRISCDFENCQRKQNRMSKISVFWHKISFLWSFYHLRCDKCQIAQRFSPPITKVFDIFKPKVYLSWHMNISVTYFCSKY